jgi:hypothetical protein
MPTAEAEAVRLDNPKLAAAAIASGGRLIRAEPTNGGRLLFVVSGVPSDFGARVMLADEVMVSARSFILAMEHVLSLIAARQRGQR